MTPHLELTTDSFALERAAAPETVQEASQHRQEGRQPELEEPTGRPMRVLECRVYRGPNPYGYRPIIRIKLDLGQLEAYSTDKLDGFKDRIMELLPGLWEHGCSYRKPGGFVRRMQEGTLIGHVVEHIALELQTRAGTRVTYGKTRSERGQPGHLSGQSRGERRAWQKIRAANQKARWSLLAGMRIGKAKRSFCGKSPIA